MVKLPRSPQNKTRRNSRPQDEAAEEGEGLTEQARTALEMSLKEVRKSNPDVLSVAVVDEVGALLASTGEIFLSTEGEKFSLGTILMFIHGMAEAGSKFFGSGQVQSVHVNCEGGKWFVIKLGSGEEARGLLGIKTTLEANLAAVMLDARQAAEKVTGLMAKTKTERKAYFEAPKRLSKLTAEDMAAWWGLRFRTMEERKKEGKRQEPKTEEPFLIKDYWDEAMRKLKKDASK